MLIWIYQLISNVIKILNSPFNFVTEVVLVMGPGTVVAIYMAKLLLLLY